MLAPQKSLKGRYTMSLSEALVLLFLSNDSPFQYIETYSGDPASWISVAFSWILMALAKGLAAFLDAMETFYRYCFQWLSFSNNSEVQNLYSILAKWIFIPIVICGIIIALKYSVGDVNRGTHKQILKNIAILFFVVAVMPTVFNFVNDNVINGLVGDGEYSIADQQLKSHTTDYYYLYESTNSFKSTFSDSADYQSETGNISSDTVNSIINDLNTQKEKYLTSGYAANVTFNGEVFNYNESMKDGENGFDCPQVYKYKVVPDYTYLLSEEGIGSELTSNDNAKNNDLSSNAIQQLLKQLTITEFDMNGTFGLGASYYMRYHIDWLNLYITMIATALMYFCLGYSVLKLMYELLIHQLFGPMMAAMDLSGGERIKKYLSSVLGCYMGLLVTSIIAQLYTLSTNYIASMRGIPTLVESLMILCTAIIFMDGPNIIAKYFGVNTGIRGGMLMAGIGLRTAGRAVGKGAKSISGHVRDRNRTYQDSKAERRKQEERRSEKAQNEKNRVAEQQNRDNQRVDEYNENQDARYDKEQSKYRNEHGSDGRYEDYQKNMSYQPGSDDNKKIMATQSAYNDLYNDSLGKDKDVESDKTGAMRQLDRMYGGINDADKESMSNINSTDINDAKFGTLKNISDKAERNGGKREDYEKAVKENMLDDQYTISSPDAKKAFVDYTTDAAINAGHADSIRTQAQNLKSAYTGSERKSDVDFMVDAMQASGYKFSSRENCERVARAELRDNGSLSKGNIYNKRPVKPVHRKYRNSQTGALID